MAYVLVLPGTALAGLVGVCGLLAGGGSFPFELLATAWFALGYLVDLAACAWAMNKLGNSFRPAAAVAGGIGAK